MSIIYGGRKRKKIKHNILYTGMGMVMNLVFTGITIFYVLGQYFARKDLPDETLLAKGSVPHRGRWPFAMFCYQHLSS